MELLVVQQIACEGPGLLDDVATRQGHALRVVKVFDGEPVPELAGYAGLVALGGPMNVYQEETYPFLRHEGRLLQQAIEMELPILGICLGAQLLAKALGARVTPNGQKEIGFCEVALTDEGRADPLFAHMSSSMPVFQWHGDTFALPQGAISLATSEVCANQAFRHGRRAYGLQFHVETTPHLVAQWVSAYRAELEEVRGVNSGGRLVKEAQLMDWLMQRQAQALFSNFLRLVEQPS